jgi:hypothetical protein
LQGQARFIFDEVDGGTKDFSQQAIHVARKSLAGHLNLIASHTAHLKWQNKPQDQKYPERWLPEQVYEA